MKLISKALLEAQKKIKNAKKDASNPHFRNNYATLESVIDAVKDHANECGLVFFQTNGKDEHGHYVETKVIHAESAETQTSKVYLIIDKQNMQGLGSSITYARRYDLAAMFGITQEDDDTNEASGIKSKSQQIPQENNKSVQPTKQSFSPRQPQQRS